MTQRSQVIKQIVKLFLDLPDPRPRNANVFLWKTKHLLPRMTHHTTTHDVILGKQSFVSCKETLGLLVRGSAAIALISGCCFIQGCSSVKKTLGMDRAPPDEFAVVPSIQPLDMPPDFFALPTPAPGAPRPQDVNEMNAKREKILGTSPQAGSVSPGQKALLDLAGAEEGQDIVRQQVDEESHIEHAKGDSLLNKLGIKKRKVGEPLNPYEESLELQKKGIPQNKTAAPEG